MCLLDVRPHVSIDVLRCDRVTFTRVRPAFVVSDCLALGTFALSGWTIDFLATILTAFATNLGRHVRKDVSATHLDIDLRLSCTAVTLDSSACAIDG
jgi:hypothetical protein